MRVIIEIALLLVLFLGVVYGALSATGNDRTDMSGKIIGICKDKPQGDKNTEFSMLVEGSSNGGVGNKNISIIITKKTSVTYKYGNTIRNASINDLKPGQYIQIKFSGPIIQTYPPQTNASQIIIIH